MTQDISATRKSARNSSDAALRGVARKRIIPSSCLAWCRLLGFEPAAHHRLIVDELCALMEQADYDTLLIFAPPGSAKSHHVSVAFPGVVAGAATRRAA